MNNQHAFATTLTAEDANRIRSGLVDEAHRSLETIEATGPRSIGVSRIAGPVLATAAVLALVVGLFVFDAGSSPKKAEAMFTVTPHGQWIDITPNLAVDSFDADAAVEELRSAGFTAERGTYRAWRDENGGLNHEAPPTDGLNLSSHGFEFRDGTEVMLNIEGPVGAEFPTMSDGKTLDWEAAAAQFGFRNPFDRRDGLELRKDAPVKIWVLTA